MHPESPEASPFDQEKVSLATPWRCSLLMVCNDFRLQTAQTTHPFQFAICVQVIEFRWYRALQMHRGGQSHGGVGGSYWFQHQCPTVSHDASRQKNKHKSLHFQSLHLTLFDSSDNGTSSRAYYRAKGRLGVSTEPRTSPIRPEHQIW